MLASAGPESPPPATLGHQTTQQAEAATHRAASHQSTSTATPTAPTYRAASHQSTSPATPMAVRLETPSLTKMPTGSLTSTTSFVPRNFSNRKFTPPLEGPDNRSLRVASLNLGGRNTNPIEFELKGDTSEIAVEVTSMLRSAQRALQRPDLGPASMLREEREAVDGILSEIFAGGTTPAPLYDLVQELFRCETWKEVVAGVKEKCPDLFNALNLPTLQLKRPSVWEDPTSCSRFTTTVGYFGAWKDWYRGLDRGGQFWREDAPRSAKKRGIDAAAAFAGLLLYDAMSLLTAMAAAAAATSEEDAIPEEEGREVPFQYMAGLVGQLPSASLQARHNVAEVFIKGAHVLFAQEARDFVYCPTVADEFLAPICARDGFTGVFLRKGAFEWVVDISEQVAKRMEHLVDRAASEHAKKAWRTSAYRLAAVWCLCLPQSGGFRACLVSLHCSKSDHTAAFLEALKGVLDEYGADINIAGLDSNCGAEEAEELQQRLRAAGLDVGCQPRQNQVTVAKRRTSFQTQVRKIGETDISHKDYVVSWSSRRICRAATAYTPDLRTAYGVEQETKQIVRLPTTQWPFDHCGVTTFFKEEPSREELVVGTLRNGRFRLACCMVCFLLAMLLLPPLASPGRRGVYGPEGSWHTDPWAGSRRAGVCEARAPCPEGWVPFAGSCYTSTPDLGYEEASDWCSRSSGEMVAIGSEAENRFIVGSVCPRGELCWIGLLNDHEQEESRWASGEPVTYTRLETYQELFPLIPMSYGADYQASVLSNAPAEMQGCRWDYAASFTTRPGAAVALVELLVPAAATVVSGAILLLPRLPHRLTSVYFLLAFTANIAWYFPRMYRVCFANNIGQYRFMGSIGDILDEGMHTATSLLTLWIIIQRMSVLQPAWHLKIGFATLLGSTAFMMAFAAVFVDPKTTLSVESPAVYVAIGFKFVTFIIFLLLGTMMCRDLARVWRLMRREAASGKSGQASTDLGDGIRAAEQQFYGILAATFSAWLRCAALLALVVGMYGAVYPLWARTTWTLSTLMASITNDLCAYLLSLTNMDGAILRAKGITNELIQRASREVEQHRLAVRVLTAAPTSSEQLRHLGELEIKARSSARNETEDQSFLVLQSAIRTETTRINSLMLCVRLRAMTMPVRYQYLIDVPVLESCPRQHVPERFAKKGHCKCEAKKYFSWLYNQAPMARSNLFLKVNQLLASFNKTPWPSDLGLSADQFPWTIWAGGAAGVGDGRLRRGDAVSPGDILLHCPAAAAAAPGRRTSREAWSYCVVLEEIDACHVKVHRSGKESAEEVPREELRFCTTGGVFIPGPLKKKQRCLDKVAVDYQDSVAWPPAASLTDIARCSVVLDDPYAIAVMVGYIQSNMKVVRLKNRFSEDLLEPLTPEDLQAQFYRAADQDVEVSGGSKTTPSGSKRSPNEPQYRDISVNVEVETDGVPFVCEIQLTLSNLAILKNADQKLYSIRRMRSSQELLRTYVFSTEDQEAEEEGPGQCSCQHEEEHGG